MSVEQGCSFFETTVRALAEANLGGFIPQDLLGKRFMFGSEFGSHHEILTGTIQAIGVSDEGGLELYVSAPRFWGAPLKSLLWNNGKWSAYIDDPRPENRFYAGEFQFLYD